LEPLSGLSSEETTRTSKERKPGEIQTIWLAVLLQIQIGEIIKYRNLPLQPHNTSRYCIPLSRPPGGSG
jgi:hypothetical protein